MARRRLTEEELALELDMSDDEATGFSDDSIADQDYSYEGSSGSSENEFSEDDVDSEGDVEDEAGEIFPLADVIPERNWELVIGDRLNFTFSADNTGVHADIIQKLSGASPISFLSIL